MSAILLVSFLAISSDAAFALAPYSKIADRSITDKAAVLYSNELIERTIVEALYMKLSPRGIHDSIGSRMPVSIDAIEGSAVSFSFRVPDGKTEYVRVFLTEVDANTKTPECLTLPDGRVYWKETVSSDEDASFMEFLRSRKRDIAGRLEDIIAGKGTKKIVLCVGHRDPEADAVMSSLEASYLFTAVPGSGLADDSDIEYFPLIQDGLDKATLEMLESSGITREDLILYEDIDGLLKRILGSSEEKRSRLSQFLLDHNIPEHEDLKNIPIIGVWDHHSIADGVKLPEHSLIRDSESSTASIVSAQCRKYGRKLSAAAARRLLGAIFLDLDAIPSAYYDKGYAFKSMTATVSDVEEVEYLRKIAGLEDVSGFLGDLILNNCRTRESSDREWAWDYKEYAKAGRRFGIGQTKVADFTHVTPEKIAAIERFMIAKRSKGLEGVYWMFTSMKDGEYGTRFVMLTDKKNLTSIINEAAVLPQIKESVVRGLFIDPMIEGYFFNRKRGLEADIFKELRKSMDRLVVMPGGAENIGFGKDIVNVFRSHENEVMDPLFAHRLAGELMKVFEKRKPFLDIENVFKVHRLNGLWQMELPGSGSRKGEVHPLVAASIKPAGNGKGLSEANDLISKMDPVDVSKRDVQFRTFVAYLNNEFPDPSNDYGSRISLIMRYGPYDMETMDVLMSKTHEVLSRPGDAMPADVRDVIKFLILLDVNEVWLTKMFPIHKKLFDKNTGRDGLANNRVLIENSENDPGYMWADPTVSKSFIRSALEFERLLKYKEGEVSLHILAGFGREAIYMAKRNPGTTFFSLDANIFNMREALSSLEDSEKKEAPLHNFRLIMADARSSHQGIPLPENSVNSVVIVGLGLASMLENEVFEITQELLKVINKENGLILFDGPDMPGEMRRAIDDRKDMAIESFYDGQLGDYQFPVHVLNVRKRNTGLNLTPSTVRPDDERPRLTGDFYDFVDAGDMAQESGYVSKRDIRAGRVSPDLPAEAPGRMPTDATVDLLRKAIDVLEPEEGASKRKEADENLSPVIDPYKVVIHRLLAPDGKKVTLHKVTSQLEKNIYLRFRDLFVREGEGVIVETDEDIRLFTNRILNCSVVALEGWRDGKKVLVLLHLVNMQTKLLSDYISKLADYGVENINGVYFVHPDVYAVVRDESGKIVVEGERANDVSDVIERLNKEGKANISLRRLPGKRLEADVFACHEGAICADYETRRVKSRGDRVSSIGFKPLRLEAYLWDDLNLSGTIQKPADNMLEKLESSGFTPTFRKRKSMPCRALLEYYRMAGTKPTLIPSPVRPDDERPRFTGDFYDPADAGDARDIAPIDAETTDTSERIVNADEHQSAYGMIKEYVRVNGRKPVVVNFDAHSDMGLTTSMQDWNWVSYALQDGLISGYYWVPNSFQTSGLSGLALHYDDKEHLVSGKPQELPDLSGEDVIVTIDLDYIISKDSPEEIDERRIDITINGIIRRLMDSRANPSRVIIVRSSDYIIREMEWIVRSDLEEKLAEFFAAGSEAYNIEIRTPEQVTEAQRRELNLIANSDDEVCNEYFARMTHDPGYSEAGFRAAFLDGKPVGIAGYRILRSQEDGRVYAHFQEELQVKEGFGGKGVGKKLALSVIDHFRARGACEYSLVISPYDPAQRLWNKIIPPEYQTRNSEGILYYAKVPLVDSEVNQDGLKSTTPQTQTAAASLGTGTNLALNPSLVEPVGGTGSISTLYAFPNTSTVVPEAEHETRKEAAAVALEVLQAETLADKIKTYASEAKDEETNERTKVIIGIETAGWMPDEQKDDMQALTSEVRQLVDTLKRRGALDNITVVLGNSEALLSNIANEKPGKSDKVVVLGSEKTLTSREYKALEAFKACVDLRELGNLDYISLLETLTVALNLALGGETNVVSMMSHPGISIETIGERIVRLIPLKKIDINEPSKVYRLQIKELAKQA